MPIVKVKGVRSELLSRIWNKHHGSNIPTPAATAAARNAPSLGSDGKVQADCQIEIGCIVTAQAIGQRQAQDVAGWGQWYRPESSSGRFAR